MDLTEFVIHVTDPIFEIGAKPGDDILVRPGDEQPVTIVRSIRPAYGELAAALSEGRADAVSLNQTEVVACLVRLASQQPAPCPPSRRRWKRA